MDSESLIRVSYLLANILLNRFKSRIHDPVCWGARVLSYLRSRHFIIHSVPECLVSSIFKKSLLNGFCHNCLIIRGRSSALFWYDVVFTCDSKAVVRRVQIVFCPWVPTRTVICSDLFLYNIKQAFSLLPNHCFFVEVLILRKLNRNLILNKAESIQISVIRNDDEDVENIFEKALQWFLRVKHVCYKRDLLAINLDLYSPYKVNKTVYIRILDAAFRDCGSDDGGFYICDETSVYRASDARSFVPSSRFEALENSRISSISRVVPVAFVNHFRILSKWFRPVFNRSINGLKAVFALSGASGVGKSSLLKMAAKQLGVQYCRLDSNDLISSTAPQIQANFNRTFNRIKKSSPSIVQICNVELLCYECDSNDTVQLISALSDHIDSCTSDYPIVFVITCHDFYSLPEKLTAFILAHHHMLAPSKPERESLLTRLANNYSVTLSRPVLDYLISKTDSFVLADLHRVLSVGHLKCYKASRTDLLIQDFTSALDGMSKIEKANVGEVEWEDVGGVEEIKRAVLSSIETGRLGGLRRTGLLLHGPPGTGKTLLARAVASQVSAAFIPVKGPELLNMYIGQSEANVRQVFSRAKHSAPCILFFDELDSLAPSRGNQSSGGVMDRVVSQLLSEMDGLESEDGVFVLAATNRPDLIDPALLRPGRLDKMIYVGPFRDRDSKLKVLKAITRKFIFKENFNYDRVIELLPNEVTGAQLSAICYDAWMASARQVINEGNVNEDSEIIVGLEHFKSVHHSANINF